MVPLKGFASAIPEPRLTITSTKTFTGDAGDSLRIPITVRNDGTFEAYNVSVVAEIEQPGNVYIEGSGYDKIGDLYNGDSGKASFNVVIDENATSGSYTMNIEISYEDSNFIQKTTTDRIYIRVNKEKETTPQLTISRVDIMPAATINPGDNVVVGFELENIGDGPARDVKLTLKGLSNDTFSLQTGLSTKTVQSIDKGKKNYVYFELKSSKRLAAGNYELQMEYSFKDDKNQTIPAETNNFFIGVASNSDKASQLLIQNLYYPTGSIGQNKEVNVSFEIKNQGQTAAKNIVVRADSQDQSGLVPKTLSMVRIDSLDPGKSTQVKFVFLTTKNGETKNYPIDITVEYTDALIEPDKREPINQFIGIFAVAPNEPDPNANQSTPKLIIDKYSFEPSLVKAGENFSMNLSFFNTNSTKTVKNIKIFLTSDERTDTNSNSAGGSVFTPVDSSNTFYIDSIPPKGRVEKSITMFTVPDAAAKTYTLTANFEYEDTQANPFEATELIGVPVIQQSKLDTGEIGVSPEAYIGQSTPISIEFFNTGKVTLYNMMVKLEGDFQTENGQYYVGNFTSGSSEYFEGYVIPSAPGELKGAVVFSYEDSTGQEQQIREEFILNVMDMPMEPEFPGEMPPFEEPQTGGIFSNKLLLGGIGAVAAIIIAVVVIKKRKKKKLEAMNIDD